MLFVVGYSRSGTTMMGRILGTSPEVHTFGELHFFESQVDAAAIVSRPILQRDSAIALIERLLTTSRHGLFHPVQRGAFHSEVEAILASTKRSDAVSLYLTLLAHETTRMGKRIACEQTPRYLYFIDEILLAIPEARCIAMVRDPRDVLLSQANKWRRRSRGARNIPRSEAFRSWTNYHPLVIAQLWTGASRHIRRLSSDPRVMVVKFESLLQEPEQTLREICSHARIDFSPAMLNVPQIGSSNTEDRPDRLGINTAVVSRWQQGGLSKAEIAICERVAATEMEAHGYMRTGASLWRPSVVWHALILAFKVPLAFVLNLSRTKNLVETLKRRVGRRG